MDYLEYQNYLAHSRIYVSHNGGPKQEIKSSKSSFGTRVRKRLAGAKAAGSKILSGGGGGGSVGGKSGRKWKSHKYIAIVNGRYIYPAKQAARETFTTKGREAKRVRLSRDVGRASSQHATAKARNDRASEQVRQAMNAMAPAKSSKDKRDIGRAEEKYAVARAQEHKSLNEMGRASNALTKARNSLDRANRRTIGETYRAIRDGARGSNASTATKQKETVRFASKANLKKPGTKTVKNDISSHKKAATTNKPKTQESQAKEQTPDRRNLLQKAKDANPRFGQLGPDPNKVKDALDEIYGRNKKKKKK